jgi:preprotein translocase subunit SecF
MMNLMRYKIWFFIASTLLIIPGIVFILMGGLKFGIDFTGGALLEYKFENTVKKNDLEKYGTVVGSGENTYIIRTGSVSNEQLQEIKSKIGGEFGNFEVRREENVGPVIGKELERKAGIALVLSWVMIVLYITFAFRKVPKPASSFRFGVAAIAALVHDVLLLIGVFAIFGYFFHVEIDTLFVTALLTVIGFSVHDTIVVFDRIRENLPKHLSKKFETVVDVSISQTLGRSLNTSLTVVFVLTALLLFGGETIRWFVVALLIGIISGTYSSIFNAAALLTWWEEKLGH